MKKGFTLIELLAVIIILSILMILAVPQVLKSLASIKDSAFVTEVQQMYKAAQHQYTVNAMMGTSLTCYTSTDTGANIKTSGENLKYKINISYDGKISAVIVYSPTMGIELDCQDIHEVTDIKIDETSDDAKCAVRRNLVAADYNRNLSCSA